MKKKYLPLIALLYTVNFSYSQSPIYTIAGYGANYSINGAYLGWNISGGGGETNFVNNIGGGWMGGFTFDNTTSTNATTRLMTILANGKVGIGTSSPSAGLDVWNGATHVVGGYSANYSVDGAYLGWNISGGGGETNFVNNIGGGWMGGFTFDNTTHTNVVTRLMTILGSGNVGIGTITPDAKLAVNGTIHAKEVKVDLTGWPDYVFKPSYF
jgi:hypothetical protein